MRDAAHAGHVCPQLPPDPPINAGFPSTRTGQATMHNLMSCITKVGDQFEEVKTILNDPNGPLHQRFTGLDNRLTKVEQNEGVLCQNQQ